MVPLEMEQPVDCMVQAGFNGIAPGIIKCKAVKSLQVGYTTPAIVYVYNHDADIVPGSTNTIRIVRVENPKIKESPILDEPLRVHFTAWTFDTFENDYIRIALETTLNVFDKGTLLDPAETFYTEPMPTCAITETFTTISSDLSTTIDLGVILNINQDFVIYEFDKSFTLPVTGSGEIDCNGSNACQIYTIASWIVYFIAAPVGPNPSYVVTFVDNGSSTFKTPDFIANSYTMKAYTINDGAWVEDHTFTPINTFVITDTLNVGISHFLSTLNRRTYDVWTFDITPTKGSLRIQRIDIHFPAEFQWLDSECIILDGIDQASENYEPIRCLTDCDQEVCTGHVTVTNFDQRGRFDTIQVNVGAMNPLNIGTTSDFEVYLYASETDTSQTIEFTISGAVIINFPEYPLDYWVDWVTESIYDRTINDSEYGEIWIRYSPRVTLPSDSGWYRVILPEEFDIAPDAKPECTVVHVDMPFDNYPQRWKNPGYHHTIVPRCIYNDREIQVMFPGDILREFYGVDAGICTYLVLTTKDSSIAYEGYRAPLTPGCYQIQFFAMIDTDVVEAGLPNICTVSQDLPPGTLQLNLSSIDTSWDSIVELAFTTENYIPPGYFYYEGNFPGPQGYIVFEFDVYDSFDLDLAGQHDANFKVDCRGVKGIQPPEGELLDCILTYGVYIPPPSLDYTPATIVITNFEQVFPGTEVEVHLPVIRNPQTNGFEPRIYAGVYEVDYKGNVNWIYNKTLKRFPNVMVLGAIAVVSPVAVTSTSTHIRDKVDLKLYFKAQDVGGLPAGSKIIFEFPAQYENIPWDGVYARIIKNPLTNPATETYIVDNLKTVTYPDAKMVALTIPTGKTVLFNEQVDIILYDFVNPSYMLTCGSCPIFYYSIDTNNRVRDRYQTGNVDTVLSLEPGYFTSLKMQLSNYFAGRPDVSAEFEFQSDFELGTGTSIKIGLPSTYPSLVASNPPPSCTSTIPNATCTLFTDHILISGYDKISAKELHSVQLSGFQNPPTATVNQGATGFTIISQDASSRTIGYQEFAMTRINPDPAERRVFLKVDAQYPNSDVVTNYNLTMALNNDLPKNGIIEIDFPAEYDDLPNGEICHNWGALRFFKSCTISGNKITIVADEEIPKYAQFGISLSNVRNPLITSPDSNNSQFSSNFKVRTSYDNIVLDQTDDTDPDTIFYIKPIPNDLIVINYNLSPTTEAEAGFYQFELQLPIDLSTSFNSSLILEFPQQYGEDLLSLDYDLFCNTVPEFKYCSVQPYRRIELAQPLDEFKANSTSTIQLFGIMNPQAGTSGSVKAYLYNNSEKTLIAKNENVGTFEITEPPGLMDLLGVTSTSYLTHDLASYNFTINAGSEEIPSAGLGNLFVDWPGNYYNLFTDTDPGCVYFTNTGEQTDQSQCSWETQTGKKRNKVQFPNPIPGDYGDFIVKMQQLQTLQTKGKTGGFYMGLYNSELREVIIRSFPNLTPNFGQLEFINQGHRIFINSTVIEVYQGSYSDPIKLSMELPTYDIVKIVPVALEGDIVSFEPPNVDFQYIWGSEQYFRVSCPFTTVPGEYRLRFTKIEKDLYEENRKYAKLADIVVRVLEADHSLTVFSEDIADIPLSGKSLPIKLSLDRPSFDCLTILIETYNPVQPDYVFISPNSITFEGTQLEQFYEITVVPGAVSGYIKYTLTCETEITYHLDRQTVPFQTLAPDTTPPEIHSCKLKEIARTIAKIEVIASEPVKIHCIYTLIGTQKPPRTWVVSGKGLTTDVLQEYTSTYVDTVHNMGIISISGLKAQTKYVAFIVLEDQAGLTSMGVQELYFETLPKYPPVKFRVYCNSKISPEVVRIGTVITLAVPEDLILLTDQDPALGDISRRNLLNDQYDFRTQYYYEMTFNMKADFPYKSAIYYLQELNELKSEFAVNIPNFNTTYNLLEYVSEIANIKPEFSGNITYTSDESNVYVVSKLNVEGTVYGVALKPEQKVPSSVQIREGLNAHNVKVNEGRFAYQKLLHGEASKLEFTGLIPNTNYTVHLTAENALIGEPDLLETPKNITVSLGEVPEYTYYYEFKYLNGEGTLSLGVLALILLIA